MARMLPRLLALVASGALLAPLTLIAAAHADDARGCTALTDAFLAQHEASGGAFTHEVAQALRAAADACPAAEHGATLPTRIDVPFLGSQPDYMDWGVYGKLPRMQGAVCGWTLPQEKTALDVPMQGYVGAVVVMRSFSDRGDATATFDPASGLATYATRGTAFGFSSTSLGKGIVTVANVSIPADTAFAEGGCSATNPGLCWSFGFAEVHLAMGNRIYIDSKFHEC